jgi:hypothetical protein
MSPMCSVSATSAKEGRDVENVRRLQGDQQYHGKVSPSHS